MKSSQSVMKQRCRELGLFVYGDKQALLARIVNEENRLTTDSQVKVSDTDQEMLRTFGGTESLAMDLNPVPEATGSTALPDDFERCNELRRWCLSHSGERPRCRSHDKKQTSLAGWLFRAKARRARSINKFPYGRQLTTKETAHLNSILRATVAPPFIGHDDTTSMLDMKSSTSNREQTHCKRAAPSTSKRLRQ